MMLPKKFPRVKRKSQKCNKILSNFPISKNSLFLGDLQDTTKRSSQYGEKLSEARTCLERALQIFELHYGVWHKTHREIAQKLANISVLVDA